MLRVGTGTPSTSYWIGVINTTDMTITFTTGQELDEAYGYDPLLMYKGTTGITTVKDEDSVGTIAADGGISIDLLAIEPTGDNAGYV